jgi:glucose/arabinose dehydrogenase
MHRRSTPVSRIAALSALAVTSAVLASSCSGTEEPNPDKGTGGSAGTTGGSSAGTTGGSSAGTTGGGVAAGAGGATGSGGSGAGTSGTSQTGGAGGSVPQAGTSGGTTPVAGTGGDGAGTSGTGGVSAGGQGGSAAGSAGAGTGGSAGQGGDWWFNGPRVPPPTGTWPPPAIKFTEVGAGSKFQPTAIAAPRADNTRIYFTEKWGRIRLIKDGVLLPDPALDMRMAVLEGGPQNGAELEHQGKRGLVGLAFHPNYADNGRIFVLYVADQGTQGTYGTSSNQYDDGDMTIADYRRSASNPDVFDPTPVNQVLQFDKGNCNQCSQHNGGSLEVDVDGFLWASTGDPPPYEDAGSQQLDNLNGKLLRFDISGETVTAAGNYPGADPYVASIGIRNAYKFSVDRYTGDIYVGDVGENDREEISIEPYGQRNKNYGWPMREGTLEFWEQPCDGCLVPVYDYRHTGTEGTPGADNCIIGGYVYRGTAIPALQGSYVYADNGSGKVYAIQAQNGAMSSQGAHNFPGLQVFAGCFGEDAAGELYVCDYNNNKILRVDAQ